MVDIQWGDVATWTASVAALIFGGLGFWRAGKANKSAADALLAAKRQASSAEKANRTADEALGIAHRATKAAEESAAEAKRTADIAELSNARAGERNDVAWAVNNGRDGGAWRARNFGADIAYGARVILKGDGVDVQTEPRDVAHGESLEIDLRERWKAAEIAFQEELKRSSVYGGVFAMPPTLRLTYRVLWKTRTGAEHVWTTDMATQKAQAAKSRN